MGAVFEFGGGHSRVFFEDAGEILGRIKLQHGGNLSHGFSLTHQFLGCLDLSLCEELPGGTFERSDETQTEYCYTKEQLENLLNQTGFEVLGCFGDWEFSEPKDHCERYYFVARAKK